jgi:hypothetical protein
MPPPVSYAISSGSFPTLREVKINYDMESYRPYLYKYYTFDKYISRHACPNECVQYVDSYHTM